MHILRILNSNRVLP